MSSETVSVRGVDGKREGWYDAVLLLQPSREAVMSQHAAGAPLGASKNSVIISCLKLTRFGVPASAAAAAAAALTSVPVQLLLLLWCADSKDMKKLKLKRTHVGWVHTAASSSGKLNSAQPRKLCDMSLGARCRSVSTSLTLTLCMPLFLFICDISVCPWPSTSLHTSRSNSRALRHSRSDPLGKGQGRGWQASVRGAASCGCSHSVECKQCEHRACHAATQSADGTWRHCGAHCRACCLCCPLQAPPRLYGTQGVCPAGV